MASRLIDFDSKSCDLVMPYPPNWTAVGFFGILGLLHLTIAAWSFWQEQFAGHVSLILGTVFSGSTIFAYRFRYEVGVLRSEARLRVRTTLLRSLLPERSIPFARVQGVRVFVHDDDDHGRASHGDSQVEIVCDDESIDCPPTTVPRQQALFLAMAMGVQLIKVCGGNDGGESRAPVPDQVPQP